MRSCSPTPTYKQPLYGCQPDEPQASLATTNRCNHVYVVLFFILLFMYAVIHCLYSVGNKITTTTKFHSVSWKKKKLQNTQSTTSLAKKIPKNSQPYRNPMLWARKNLTILLHNNIHYFSKSDSIELIWPIKISFPGNIQQNFTECHQNQQVPPGIITNIPTDNKNQNMLVGKGLILK